MAFARRYLAGCLVLAGVVAVHGASFTVDTTTDAVDASSADGLCATAGGECSLRAAISQASELAGHDEVDVPAGTYALTLGQLFVADGDMAITGAGAATTIVDGGGTTRVFNVGSLSTSPVVISGITIRNGRAASGVCGGPSFSIAGGGAICAFQSPVTVMDAVIEGNASAQGRGDALSGGTFTLVRTTVRNNGGGNGSAAIRASVLTVSDSTVSGNSAGGIHVDVFESATITNTTFSANGATAIRVLGSCNPSFCPSPGSVTLANVTVTGHSGPAIHNLRQYNGLPATDPYALTTVANSVFGGNGSTCTGGLVSNGYNMFESVVGCEITNDATGNVIGVTAGLGPLQDNGGPTATHALVAPSPATNAGNPAVPGSGGSSCPAADQRGVARPQGGRCDAGAVESSCGDGTVDPGEECDDGNLDDGDTCGHSCAVPRCGDGILQPGEQCDDANTATGDCCTSCQADAAGTSCTTDSNACTDDVCDGAGRCHWNPNTLPCDDGDLCTRGDVCSGGSCQPGPNCAGDDFPCITCIVGVGCGTPVDVFGSCTAPASRKSRLRFKDDTRDLVSWRWRSAGEVTKNDFGSPTFGFGHTYCLTANDDAGGTYKVVKVKDGCDALGCWTETSRGFKYASAAGAPDRLKIVLTAGTPARIVVRTKGTRGTVPPLPMTQPVHVEFFRSNDLQKCLDATFDANVSQNTSKSFTATSE